MISWSMSSSMLAGRASVACARAFRWKAGGGDGHANVMLGFGKHVGVDVTVSMDGRHR